MVIKTKEIFNGEANAVSYTIPQNMQHVKSVFIKGLLYPQYL